VYKLDICFKCRVARGNIYLSNGRNVNWQSNLRLKETSHYDNQWNEI